MAPASDDDPLARHAISPAELKVLLGAERDGTAFVAFRDEAGQLRLFSPKPGAEASTIGRRPETDITIDWDGEVSGLHAELHHVGGEWAVVDDGLSRNGTYLDNQRISGRQRLRDESRIRVGKTVLAYRAAHVAAVGETVIAGERPTVRLTESQRRVLLALCRPYRAGGFGTPATNQQIAEEVFLSVDAVKMHLRALFAKYGLAELPQNQKRVKLAESALQSGEIAARELD